MLVTAVFTFVLLLGLVAVSGAVLDGTPSGVVFESAEADMEKVIAITGGERTFRDASLVGGSQAGSHRRCQAEQGRI